jgi:hypothetical protein
MHSSNRRYKGRSTPGKKGGPKRDGPGDQPRMVQAARALSISAEHEREARGTGICHGLVVAMKEGNASGAKEPWAKAVWSGRPDRNSESGKAVANQPDEVWSKPARGQRMRTIA